ncbi:hypothetical protein AB0I51_09170 [Streptomyces sp. NPDC050549]
MRMLARRAAAAATGSSELTAALGGGRDAGRAIVVPVVEDGIVQSVPM